LNKSFWSYLRYAALGLFLGIVITSKLFPYVDGLLVVWLAWTSVSLIHARFRISKILKTKIALQEKLARELCPNPDRLQLNAAIVSLIEKDGDDLEAARLLVWFAGRFKVSSDSLHVRLTTKNKQNTSFTGHTDEFGDVSVNDGGQEQRQTKVLKGELHEVLVGHYRVWRTKETVHFTHFWKSRLTSLGSDFANPPVYMVEFDYVLNPLAFCRMDFTQTEKIVRGTTTIFCEGSPKVLHIYEE
jgi:hypothetical protein